MKRIVCIILAFVLLITTTACGSIVDTAKDIGNKAAEIGNDIADFATDKAELLKRTFSEVSLPDFKKGFESAASFFGTTVASIGGQNYVKQVADAIDQLEKNIVDRIGSGKIATEAGNAAEEWHAGTYNIDAVASGHSPSASTGKSHGLGSSDVSVGDDLQASLKYYKNANLSASQQAKNYIQRYHEYKLSSANPLSLDEWLASNKINLAADDPELYWSIYKDQVRVIPSDQLDDALACLKKTVSKELAKGGDRQYLAEADLETLKNLTDRIKTSDGVESVPLSKAEAEAIAKAAQDGNFSAAEFGITTSSAIQGSYIARQAVKAGATSAIIEAAVVLGPEIYEIIKHAIDNGEIDYEQLKNAGFDGLNAAGDGFLKGSISNAIVVMCKAGKLGAEYANCSPQLIGAMTVLIIDAIKYGIMMGNGRISTAEYIDLMAEEVLVSVGVLGMTALIGLLFPGATLAILIGGFVGGLVVSAGYTKGKTYAIAWIEQNGVDLLVHIDETAESIKGIKEAIRIKVSKAIEAIKNFTTDTEKNVKIIVYDLTEKVH